MAAQKGRLFILVDSTADPEVTVAKIRSLSISFSGETVDITNKDSAGWREILEDAGTRSASISIDGVYDSEDTTHATLFNLWANQTVNSFKIVDADDDYYEGSFYVSSYDRSGTYNGEVAFSATLESSGVISFTQA